MGKTLVKNYPSPRLMETIGATNQSAPEAIGELVANSFDARINTEKLRIVVDMRNEAIAVIDNGKGMTSKELKSLFTPFYTNKENGTGLGTINIKEIIRLHDGSIEYLSLPNKGTTVIIKLPLNVSNNN